MRRKVVTSLISLFAIFSAGSLFASWHVQRSTAELSRLVELHEVEELRRDLVINLKTVQSDLYTTHTPQARTLDGIVANVKKMDEAAQNCLSCHHRFELENQLEETQDLIEEYKTALSFYITASANREKISQIKEDAASIGDQILERTEKMSETASARLARITHSATERINNVQVILVVTIGITFCLGIVVSVYLARAVSGPVHRLVEAARVLASGQLGHRMEEEEEAEFGELARNFNQMGEALQQNYERLISANLELQREIAQRVQAEREREELQEQLIHGEKMQALGTFSAGIAHEFNNFLQLIQGSVEKLARKTGGQGPGGSELELIGETAQRGAELTRRLLTFSRKTESRRIPVDLNQSVQRVKTVLRESLPAKIEIRTELGVEPPVVRADPIQIEQMLLNLSLNARDAMPDGGILRIETARVSVAASGSEQSPAGAQGDGQAVLRVTDTGHGMDHETVRKIFDPFFTTKQVGLGTGLGLATVYGIVTGIDGQIDCESHPGRGTTFEIRLPAISEEAVAADAGAASGEAIHGGGATVLMVEDEAIVLDLVRESLERTGYSVHTADTGERAVEIFEEHEIDLVLLDLGMPGMGGQACLKRLLKIDPRARIVITTAYSSRQHEQELLEAGAVGFLAKPYRTADMLRKIEEVLKA
jgi:signal transduction histidine kinase